MVVSPDMIGKLTESEKKASVILERIIDRQLLDGHREVELKNEQGIKVELEDRVSGEGTTFEVKDKVVYAVVEKYKNQGFEVKIERFNQKTRYYLRFYTR